MQHTLAEQHFDFPCSRLCGCTDLTFTRRHPDRLVSPARLPVVLAKYPAARINPVAVERELFMQRHIAQRDVIYHLLTIARERLQIATVICLPRQSALIGCDAHQDRAAMRSPPESCPKQRQHRKGCRRQAQFLAAPCLGEGLLSP